MPRKKDNAESLALREIIKDWLVQDRGDGQGISHCRWIRGAGAKGESMDPVKGVKVTDAKESLLLYVNEKMTAASRTGQFTWTPWPDKKKASDVWDGIWRQYKKAWELRDASNSAAGLSEHERQAFKDKVLKVSPYYFIISNLLHEYPALQPAVSQEGGEPRVPPAKKARNEDAEEGESDDDDKADEEEAANGTGEEELRTQENSAAGTPSTVGSNKKPPKTTKPPLNDITTGFMEMKQKQLMQELDQHNKEHGLAQARFEWEKETQKTQQVAAERALRKEFMLGMVHENKSMEEIKAMFAFVNGSI